MRFFTKELWLGAQDDRSGDNRKKWISASERYVKQLDELRPPRRAVTTTMRAIAIIAIGLACTSPLRSANGAFTASELAVVEGVAHQRERQEVIWAHAEAADAEALETVLKGGRVDLIALMLGKWPDTRSQPVERLLRQHFADRAVATAILTWLKSYGEQETLDLLLRDVRRLAKRTSQRRALCRFDEDPAAMAAALEPDMGEAASLGHRRAGMLPRRVQRPTPPGGMAGFAFKCEEGVDPDIVGDDDVGRERGAASAITRTALPGVDAQIAELLRDVSLQPRVFMNDEEVVSPFHGPVNLPHEWMRFFVERRTRVDVSQLSDILAVFERQYRNDESTWIEVSLVLQVLSLQDSVQAGPLIAHWLVNAARIEDRDIRERQTSATIALLAQRPEGRDALAAVKEDVLASLPDTERTNARRELAEAMRLSAMLTQPTAASLMAWIQRPERLRMVPWLIDHGAPINETDGKSGLTPLLTAIQGAPQLVPYLLSNGASPNPIRPGALAPLAEAAAWAPSMEVVDALLAAGADVNVRGSTGSTPLKAAAGGTRDMHRKVAEALLAHGADPNLADSSGETPLHAAANDAGMLTLLLRSGAAASVNRQTSIGQTPLFRSTKGDAALVLLNAGADPNVIDRAGESPYSLALMHGNEEVARLLADHGGSLTAAQVGRILAQAALAPFVVPLMMIGQRH